ncbi:Alpha/Beta hydrolase protein [Catenaria anguillulae PL171]|uniref:Dipeptidyl-peptidase V n=1 Tax=Catenaria anguillulae PL171 TaxID=765915 RepID=A0A1Y2HR80_9FUNG|nr:Alpha/Beta hydrolase protein [Catenaria anguillulae PL171]
MVQTPLETVAPLIPVADFFTNPDRDSPKLSPDKKFPSYLAPAGEKQNLQIFVQPLDLWRKGTDEGRKQVTHHPTNDVNIYKWTLDSSAILFLQDKDGNEDFHLFRVDLETLTERNLTPFDGVCVGHGQINNDWFIEHQTKFNTGIVALNKRDARYHDLYHLDLDSGDLELHQTNEALMQDFFLDTNHVVRAASGSEDDGSTSVYVPNSSAPNGWAKVMTSTPLDSLHTLKWTEAGRILMLSSVDRESVALIEMDPQTSARQGVASFKLGRMDSLNFAARDGLPLQAYITYPPHFQAGNTYPMVLWPYGGPWHRNVFGYSPQTQWLANRGYIVLQPNFRGSTEFNKTLLTSGFKQWGKAMQTDLLDAVDHVVGLGIVDREHVAIFGMSYGGYCALAGVTLTPEFFTCAVDIVGPSNLKTLNAEVAPYMDSFLTMFHVRMGHPEHDSELLEEVSPLFHAHRIVRPLMISHGKNDPRVKQIESEQIVQAIEKNGGSVYYVLYTDEGHGFTRPVNRIDHFQKAELFLSKYMGDKVRTQPGLSLLDSVEGSSAVVRVIGDLAGDIE